MSISLIGVIVYTTSMKLLAVLSKAVLLCTFSLSRKQRRWSNEISTVSLLQNCVRTVVLVFHMSVCGPQVWTQFPYGWSHEGYSSHWWSAMVVHCRTNLARADGQKTDQTMEKVTKISVSDIQSISDTITPTGCWKKSCQSLGLTVMVTFA